jgi:hypothetical protein
MTTPASDRAEEIYCDKYPVKSGSKICFNPSCNNKGKNWIAIVGRYAGYSDYEVEYCVCDECNSFLDSRRQHLNDLINKLQGIGGELYQIGVNIEAQDPFSDKLTVTTKDLDNLTTDTQAYGMTESEESDKPKVCYHLHCNNEGTVINATTLLKDHEIPYCVCDECYVFFEYRRKEPLVSPSLKALFDDSLANERDEDMVSGISPETGKVVVTTKDLHNLLESNRPPHKNEVQQYKMTYINCSLLKKRLERRQVAQPGRSNTSSQNQPMQQHGVLLDG